MQGLEITNSRNKTLKTSLIFFFFFFSKTDLTDMKYMCNEAVPGTLLDIGFCLELMGIECKSSGHSVGSD